MMSFFTTFFYNIKKHFQCCTKMVFIFKSLPVAICEKSKDLITKCFFGRFLSYSQFASLISTGLLLCSKASVALNIIIDEPWILSPNT